MAGALVYIGSLHRHLKPSTAQAWGGVFGALALRETSSTGATFNRFPRAVLGLKSRNGGRINAGMDEVVQWRVCRTKASMSETPVLRGPHILVASDATADLQSVVENCAGASPRVVEVV